MHTDTMDTINNTMDTINNTMDNTMNKALLTAINMYEITKDMNTFIFVLDLIVAKFNMSKEMKESIIKSALKHIT